MARAPKKAEVEVAPFVIAIDQQEKKPLQFGLIRQPDGRLIEVRTITTHLKTGDYQIADMPPAQGFVCERKSLPDAFSTIVCRRERFIRELERMTEFKFRMIIIEGSLRDVLEYEPALDSPIREHFTEAQIKSHPRTVVNSLNRWQIRFGVHVLFADKDRNVCRTLVYRLAACFHEESRLATLGIGRGAGAKADPAAQPTQDTLFGEGA